MGAVVPALPPLEATAAEGHPEGTAGAPMSLVGPALQSGLGECVDDAVGRGGGQVVSGAGEHGRSPQRPSEWVGEDLDVHAVALVLAGVVRGVGGDPVDRRERPVEDDEGRPACGPHRLGQAGASAARACIASLT